MVFFNTGLRPADQKEQRPTLENVGTGLIEVDAFILSPPWFMLIKEKESDVR